MSRFRLRVGPSLFLATIALYLTANAVIGSLHERSLAHARSLHNTTQHFDAGLFTSVVINGADDGFRSGSLKIEIDSGASQATIHNENMRITADGKIANGVLTITLGNLAKSHYMPYSPLTISLPSSVNRVAFSGINGVDLTGNTPTPIADLKLETLNCKPNVSVVKLAVDKLRLATSCERRTDERCCEAGFTLGEGVAVGNLEVSMPSGKLTFSAKVIPQKIQLNLGETVQVTAPRPFLQAARFGKPP